jgi:hypothetical protein
LGVVLYLILWFTCCVRINDQSGELSCNFGKSGNQDKGFRQNLGPKKEGEVKIFFQLP